jgi:uncharacterized OB-fold protein
MTDTILIKEELFKANGDTYDLAACKCSSCGQVFFPKQVVCLNCHKEEMEDFVLSTRGKLFTHTTVMMPSSGFTPPYGVGYVELPEGFRLFSQLDILEDKPFKVGMEMEVYVGPLWEKDGVTTLGYRCRAV